MAFATLHIRALDQTRQAFPLQLIEGGNVTAEDELRVTQLQNGEWTVVLDDKADPSVVQRDIVALVSGMSGQDRSNYAKWTEMGGAIADWLLPPKIRQRLLQIPNPCLALDIEPAALVPVPWELGRLGPPEKRLASHFALTRLHSQRAQSDSHASWPFRILIVVGCSEQEEGDDALGVRREVSKIDKAFLPFGRSVDVEILRRPSLKDLRSRIKESHPQILHFAGHAGPNEKGEVGLRFDLPGDGASWVWSVTDMQSDLGRLSWVPQLVFLNACRTSHEQQGAWSMQRSFADVGTHAVVTMQADVRGDLAGVFAESLYKKLIERMTLQEAMREAREAIEDELGGGARIDWALPSLTAADPTVQLFEQVNRPNDAAFDLCQEFEEAKFYANCREGRRTLTRWVCPARQRLAGAAPSNVLIITGEPLSGKSHLLKWSMETWAVAGAQVRYVQLYGGHSKDFLGVLRQIRDGRQDLKPEQRYLGQGLPAEAFNRFNWELNKLLQPGSLGEWDPAKSAGTLIKDPGGPIVANSEDRPTQPLCVAFHDALKSVASNHPLILVIDQFSGPTGERRVSADDFSQLIDHLFLPIAKDAQSNVKLVFVATHNERQYYELSRLENEPTTVLYKLADHVDEKELIQHAAEMFWYEDEEVVLELAPILLRVPRAPPIPKGLGRLSDVLAGLQTAEIAQRIKRMQ